MKKLASLLMAGLLALAMIAPASAAGANEILKGTPELDGKLDDIYTQSVVYTIKEDVVNYAWGGAEIQDFSEAASYFLWDDNYLYVCTVNVDDTIVNLTGEKGWQNDAAEMWFIDEGLRHKIHAAADGNFFLGSDGDGKTAYDFAGAKSVATYTDDGWCVEVALPMNNLAAGKEFSYTLQVNNCIDGIDAGSASGSQKGDYALKCVAEEVVLPVVEEVVEEAAAPQTFDMGVIAAAVAIVSAAGYAISKKR
ncbi:MAG: hypothetical protein IKY52_04385 [Clostridia bacterium]|nr:hypothetical protein [Clostridia bacterium]